MRSFRRCVPAQKRKSAFKALPKVKEPNKEKLIALKRQRFLVPGVG